MSAPAKDPLGRWLAAGVVVLAIVAIIGAVRVMGTPGQQRTHRLDDRRVSDINRLADAIQGFHERHDRFPKDIGALDDEVGVRMPRTDPETGVAYEYRILDARRFELCAVFLNDTADEPDASTPHGAGRHCFTRKVKGKR